MGPDATARAARDERGETLLESMISIVVVAVVAIAGLTGLLTINRAGADQRVSARGETLLRSAAEQIQNPDLAYIERAGCSGSSAYALPPLAVSESGYGVAVVAVSFWTGASDAPSGTVGAGFDATCPLDDASDEGLQQVTIALSDPLGRTDSLTVLKRRS